MQALLTSQENKIGGAGEKVLAERVVELPWGGGEY
jgi:hypothetical protein